MKKTTIALFGLGIVLSLTGIFGTTFGTRSETNINSKSDVNQTYNWISKMTRWNDESYNKTMGNHSGSSYSEDYSETDKMDIESLKKQVEDYINKYKDDLEIADVFIFSNTDYYFSIVEVDSGMGAMELLVNPYTGDVYQEYGPNMMWNMKYGVMRNQNMLSNSGILGNQNTNRYGETGMMRNQNVMGHGEMIKGQNRSEQRGFDYDKTDYITDGEIKVNELSFQAALSKGNDFLARQAGDNSLSDSYHEFYGYFTFHVENKGDTSGMLSVNVYTGEVWFHSWHGVLMEIIESHK